MKAFWMMMAAVAMTVLFAAALPAAAEDQEPIKIELPEPFFGGTPIDYWSENLEPEDFKDRAPFMAPKGTEIISKGKTVSSSDKSPSLGDLKMIVDGDKNYAKNSLVELGNGPQWVQIDLEKESEVYAVLVWHFHEGKRVYFDTVLQIANDPEFKTGVNTAYNSDADNSAGLGVGKDKEYIENNKGRLIDTKGVKGRYVRLYSNGSTADEKNHYVEVEVFGRVAK